MSACRPAGARRDTNDQAKHVVLTVEGLRTRVRFPPPPPIPSSLLIWQGFLARPIAGGPSLVHLSRKFMRQASHLYRNRYNVFYFRIVVLKYIRSRMPGTPRELRRSLRTKDPSLAARKAHTCSYLLEVLLARTKGKHLMDIVPIYLGIRRLIAERGKVEIEGITLDPNHREEELELLQGVLDKGQIAANPKPLAPGSLQNNFPYLLSATALSKSGSSTGRAKLKTKTELSTEISWISSVPRRRAARQGHRDRRRRHPHASHSGQASAPDSTCRH